MPKTIKFSLSEESINQAIVELDQYAQSLEGKAARLRQLVAERIRWNAEDGFSNAIADDIYRGGERTYGDVTVDVHEDGDISIVMASGSDAVFIEFGAGVHYNGSTGNSPHPRGVKMGFTIGEYGRGMGAHDAWAIPGSTAEKPILTHGTPAAMPMYRGAREALAVIRELAEEVFGND